jgi:hypothetical protein
VHRALPRSIARLSSAISSRTDTAKSRARRNVIQGDFTDVGDATYRENGAILDGHEKRIFWFDPGPEYFRRLVAQPSLQNRRIIVVIGRAKLGYRSTHDLAGGCSILGNGVPNNHLGIIQQVAWLAMPVFVEKRHLS